jgi:hypothetical protein
MEDRHGFNVECAVRLKADLQRVKGRGLEAALTGTEPVYKGFGK